MEVDQAHKPARTLYDSDLDDDKKDDKPQEEKKEEEKKKPKRPLIKLDPAFLIDNPRGLKKLYKRVAVDADRNLQFKGKGHEISDFNKLMTQLKGWHFESMPKIEINYFAERMAKVGGDKDVKQFLHKLRLVHKGLEVMDDVQISEELLNGNNTTKTNGPAAAKPMFEYINTSAPPNPFDDYANFCNTKPTA